MGSTRVSVVIPAYNQAEFLTETVESVLAQTHPDLEVIVVNDASTDGTAAVMERVTDPRVRCIAHENNRGLPATRRRPPVLSSSRPWSPAVTVLRLSINCFAY